MLTQLLKSDVVVGSRPSDDVSETMVQRFDRVKRWVVERSPLAALSLAYLIVWGVLSIWHSVPFASLETDGIEYIQTARTIFTPGFAQGSFHGIGFPAAIWVVHLVLPDWFQSGKVVSGIAGLVLVATVYLLIESWFDRRTAVVGGLLLITNFYVMAYSVIVMSDMFAATLALLALLVLLRTEKPIRYAVAGILVGLAAITRYQYFGLIAAAAFIWLLETTNRARVRAVALYLGVFIIAAAPLLLLNWKTFGSPLANSNFANLGDWFWGAPQANSVNSWLDVFSVIAADPRYFALGYFGRLFVDLPLYLAFLVNYTLPIAVIGWVLALRRSSNRKLWLALAFLAVYCAVTGIASLRVDRYWLYAIPFVAAGGAYLVTRRWNTRLPIGAALLVILIGVNLYGSAARLPRLEADQAPEFLRAAQFIQHDSPANAIILASRPQVAYLADRPGVALGKDLKHWTELSRIIETRGVQYVVMDERFGEAHFPEFAPLLDPAALARSFPSWQLVYSENVRPRIVVYRVGSP